MEDMWGIKTVLESQGDAHNKVEIQLNLELQSLTSSPTQSARPPCLQIDTQNVYDLRFGLSTCPWKDKKILFPMQLLTWSSKIKVDHNHQNKIIFQNLPSATPPIFWSMPCVSSWSLLGTRPRVWP
jgi:hypothetical protein